ncbi:hypothetical protein [Anoxybacillus sp. FSL W8-1294]|uniref:hypothetical protein n=1 Tax=Anoxybacillus sp. FSL W8-1294 TaxID=2954655 RepID=UPI0030CBA038
MKMAGRPTKLTPELQKKIIDAIRAGNYMETAAAYAGISKDTFFRWLRKGARAKSGIYKDFHDAVEKALADAEVRDVMLIANAAATDWKAAAWRLERKFPDRWGRKERLSADLNHSGQVVKREEYDISITHEITNEILNDEEAKELAKQLLRRRNALKRSDEQS